MLVFISDLHLTDGTSGETINSGAFSKFTHYLEDMALTAKANKIEVVLLGDIFDVIRSDYWLQAQIRPWSSEDEKDGNGGSLKDYTKEIVKKICNTNKESLGHLLKFKETMDNTGVAVKYTYIVGNHDWLINRYPETRTLIAKSLKLDNIDHYKTNHFLTDKYWGDYKAFARHGDIYDPFNFEGDRDASSLGDALVIDLINRFPKEVENHIGTDRDPDLIKQLKEIDNIRPLLDIPLWVLGVCQKSGKLGEQVNKVWDRLVDDFIDIDFIKKRDTWYPFDVVDAMQIGLKLSKWLSFKDIANLPLRKFQKTEDNYIEKAFNEDYMRRNEAQYVIYGHTHGQKIQPLDLVPMHSNTIQKTYFNTGTWRKIQVKTAYDVENKEFFGRHVMTFVAFYLDDERSNYDFEVWNGSLG